MNQDLWYRMKNVKCCTNSLDGTWTSLFPSAHAYTAPYLPSFGALWDCSAKGVNASKKYIMYLVLYIFLLIDHFSF